MTTIDSEPASGPHRRRESVIWRWALIACVPVISLLVGARQFYLCANQDLSTWKGGGMGMFAGAEAAANRYAKVYIIEPGGGRHPLTRFSPIHLRLLGRALNYPTRESFLLATKEITLSDWVAASQRMPVTLIDSKGQNAGKSGESYHMMVPFGRRPASEKWEWDIQIEYWKLSYNPVTRLWRASLAQTFVFKRDEILRSR